MFHAPRPPEGATEEAANWPKPGTSSDAPQPLNKNPLLCQESGIFCSDNFVNNSVVLLSSPQKTRSDARRMEDLGGRDETEDSEEEKITRIKWRCSKVTEEKSAVKHSLYMVLTVSSGWPWKPDSWTSSLRCPTSTQSQGTRY